MPMTTGKKLYVGNFSDLFHLGENGRILSDHQKLEIYQFAHVDIWTVTIPNWCEVQSRTFTKSKAREFSFITPVEI